MSIDVAAVAAWMTSRGLGEGPLTDLEPIEGGTQNVMVRFRREGREYVLRRGPRHLRPRSNASILRERTVLEALSGTEVPHPGLIATCEDPDVLGGAAFYLMEPVEGFNPALGLPPLHAGDAGIRHRMGLELAGALATLGEVDHEAVGLGSFGRPEGFLERQVPRWLDELGSYDEVKGYPGHGIDGVDEVAAWLTERVPPGFEPGIMHGDFHAANAMFRLDGPGVAAIVDWEMCTIGDPLLDLGWLLATWRLPQAPGVFGGGLMATEGLATADELRDRYAEIGSRDPARIDWYVALACFKLGILLEGTRARAFAGKAPEATGEHLHETTLLLFERARALIGS